MEEAVTSELVSEMPISLVTGKNTGNSAPITTRALIKASQSNVLRPKFPDEETGKFSRAEQRIDLPHQGKLLRDQGFPSWVPRQTFKGANWRYDRISNVLAAALAERSYST